ncbi:MAG: Peptidase rane alanine aminopeptidase [Myxococcales bacterium]|nr:Peptidase rane alanine aminopeptidase [Myxococcales bacterium]
MLRRLLVVAICVAGCGHDHGPPTVKAKPTPTDNPAIRGGGAPRSARIANYKIDARLDAAQHSIAGTEVLTWTNTGQSAVDTLPFHLYLNAFKNESSVFWRSSSGSMRGAHASDSGWGWIQVESVQIGGVELVGKLRYPGLPDETVVELPLPQPVQPGQTIDVSFKFSEQLPEVWARTGYKGEFHMVGQWFPKIGVRVGTPGAERWECQPLHAFTEFFADFGTYDVTLTVPNTLTVAATGVLVASADLPGGTRTLTYRAEDVHDFAWMADPYMKAPLSGFAKLEDGNVEVRVYYRPEQEAFAKRHRDAAIAAIEKFSAAYLPYPWPIMTIIDPPLDAAEGAGAMEYPTLVTTAGDSVFARPGLRLPEMVTIHEVGHNWFQGMLASNEAEEAWLDEGVNEWADAHAMDDIYGARTGAIDWMGWQAEVFALRRVAAEDPGSIPTPIATAAYAFPDLDAYSEATYSKTMNALHTLEQTVGSVKFQAAMKAYARAWAWKHPTGRDFYATLEKELGQDLSWFFEPVFHEVAGLGLRIRSASCLPAHLPRGVLAGSADTSTKTIVTETSRPDLGAWVCSVLVENTGRIHIPLDIELRFADGASERVHWEDRGNGNWQRFAIERSSKLVEVILDPDNKIALDSPFTHRYRLEGDGAASLRAAARISTWAQTLMQLVGP